MPRWVSTRELCESREDGDANWCWHQWIPSCLAIFPLALFKCGFLWLPIQVNGSTRSQHLKGFQLVHKGRRPSGPWISLLSRSLIPVVWMARRKAHKKTGKACKCTAYDVHERDVHGSCCPVHTMRSRAPTPCTPATCCEWGPQIRKCEARALVCRCLSSQSFREGTS